MKEGMKKLREAGFKAKANAIPLNIAELSPSLKRIYYEKLKGLYKRELGAVFPEDYGVEAGPGEFHIDTMSNEQIVILHIDEIFEVDGSFFYIDENSKAVIIKVVFHPYRSAFIP